jgi:hypothetical protein
MTTVNPEIQRPGVLFFNLSLRTQKLNETSFSPYKLPKMGRTISWGGGFYFRIYGIFAYPQSQMEDKKAQELISWLFAVLVGDPDFNQLLFCVRFVMLTGNGSGLLTAKMRRSGCVCLSSMGETYDYGRWREFANHHSD